MVFDVAIVGGGPAGISTALFLHAVAPHVAERTVVLEKRKYPRDKFCAGAIGARAFRKLDAIGVSVDVPSADVSAVSVQFAAGDRVVERHGLGHVVRRIEFDHALAKQAAARGITVREGTAVSGLELGPRSVALWLEGGETVRARTVVGADGVAGIVRRAVGLAPSRLRAQAVEVDTDPSAGDPRSDALHFDFRLRDLNGYAWDFPTIVGGERKVCRGVYVITDRQHEPARFYLARYLELRGLSIADYRIKQYAERGFEPGAAMSRPRVILVGEAAGIDIASGEGIPQAIAYGQLAATYLSGALRDGEFGFADWRHQVRSAGVGKRLRIRHLAYELFFGDRRDLIERVALDCPALMDVAVRDFAGVAYGPIDVARGLLQLVPQVAEHPSLFTRSLEVLLSRGR